MSMLAERIREHEEKSAARTETKKTPFTKEGILNLEVSTTKEQDSLTRQEINLARTCAFIYAQEIVEEIDNAKQVGRIMPRQAFLGAVDVAPMDATGRRSVSMRCEYEDGTGTAFPSFLIDQNPASVETMKSLTEDRYIVFRDIMNGGMKVARYSDVQPSEDRPFSQTMKAQGVEFVAQITRTF